MPSRRAVLALGAGAVVSCGVGAAAAGYLPEPGTWFGADDVLDIASGRSDDVCESYAVNTKLFYASQVYAQTDAVIDLLTELGVRTVRERVATGSSPGALNQRYAMPLLAERGIRWHPTVGELDQWPVAEMATREALSLLTDFYAPAVGGDLSDLIHSLGGCNEVDGPVVDGEVDPQWPAHTKLMQRQLWQQATADPRTAGLPVVGPSTRTDVTLERAQLLGDLSTICDWGNAHLYNRGGSPSRLIDEQMSILKTCFPDADRWFFTETGYNDAPETDAGRTIPEEAAATYAVRAICDFHSRAAIYGRFELLDDPDVIDFTSQETIDRTASREAHFGLVAMTEPTVAESTPETWRRKPEFYATQRFLRLVSDRGSAFTAEPLRARVSGGGDDLRQLVVQKRDGRHYMLLWRDVDVAEPYPSGRALQVAPTTISINVAPNRPVAVYVPRESAAPVQTFAASQQPRVEVAGDLVALEIG